MKSAKILGTVLHWGVSSVKGYGESWLYLKQAGRLASKRAIKDFYVVTLN